jgi:N-acetylmuramoyl-L-alanine amidase
MQQALAAPIRITDFRFSEDQVKTRLVFDANGQIVYTVKEFPNKIIVNIKNAKLIGLLNKTWLHKTPVKTVQSEQIGGNLRLILNLKKIVKVKHFALQKPYRLVFDLFETKAVSKASSRTQSAASTTVKTPKKPQLKANKKLRYVTIVLDPGHGGKEPGAVGYRGTREKDISLAIAKALQNQELADKKIVITGHTDNVGSAEGNLRLSRRRAQAVEKALLNLGIAKSRLRARGLGESEPLADNLSAEGRSRNRRVTLSRQ